MQKNKIKQILLEQNEEPRRLLAGRAVPREKEALLAKALSEKLIKVIIGVRRCGKSFLAHRVLRGQRYGFMNFDDERLIGTTAQDLNDFLEVIQEINPGVRTLLLDEVQNVPGWELFANRLHRNGYNLIITGSNSKMLSKEFATHLTGRHMTLELYPFSFREFLQWKNITIRDDDLFLTDVKALLRREFTTYFNEGGFPEVFTAQLKGEYLKNLYTTIITRDIVERYNVRQIRTLKEMILYALSNSGSAVTYHKLKNVFDIKSVHTVKNYLSYAEDSYLIGQLGPFSYKIKEVVRGARKIYGIDHGLIQAVTSPSSPNQGHLLETMLFLELRREGMEISYYKDRSGHEIDFVVKEGTRIVRLIQGCLSIEHSDTRKREVRALLKGSAALRCLNLSIVTLDEEGEDVIDGKKIFFVPLYQWLLKRPHQ